MAAVAALGSSGRNLPKNGSSGLMIGRSTDVRVSVFRCRGRSICPAGIRRRAGGGDRARREATLRR
jgi:hypothetical protein